jgi:hypothetical protein
MAMANAAHYRDQANTMRMFAASAPNEAMRQMFLDLAAEYDKLAKSADEGQQSLR